MASKLIQMEKIDPCTFITGVFAGHFCLACNSLVSITVGPQNFEMDKDFQSLQQVHETLNDIGGSYWASILGPTSLGQYTARKHSDVFVFARNDVVFRKPTPAETQHDFEHFTEQVMGPEMTDEIELNDTETGMRFLGKQYVYTGPPRLVDATLTARIVTRTGIPSDFELEDFKKQIDDNYGKPENSVFQFYLVLIAEKSHNNSSKLKMIQYGKDAEFSPGKMQFLGSVQAIEEQERLLFYPENDISKQIDFSCHWI